jgi:hypothetical protein
MGPGEFFARIGFTPSGETEYGELIGEIQVLQKWYQFDTMMSWQ